MKKGIILCIALSYAFCGAELWASEKSVTRIMGEITTGGPTSADCPFTPQAQIVLNGASFSPGDSLTATFKLNESIMWAFTAFAVIILPNGSMLNALTLDTPLTPVATNVPSLSVPFTFPLINTTISAGAPTGTYELLVAFFDPTRPITGRYDAFLVGSKTFSIQ